MRITLIVTILGAATATGVAQQPQPAITFSSAGRRRSLRTDHPQVAQTAGGLKSFDFRSNNPLNLADHFFVLRK